MAEEHEEVQAEEEQIPKYTSVRKFLLRSYLEKAGVKGLPKNPKNVGLAVVPQDPRFATTQDQAKACWSLFNEFLRCVKVKGKDAPVCSSLRSTAYTICPSEWTNQWHEQRAGGTFPGIEAEYEDPAEPEPEEEEKEEAEDEDEDDEEDDEDDDEEGDDEEEAEEEAAPEPEPAKPAKAAAKAPAKAGKH